MGGVSAGRRRRSRPWRTGGAGHRLGALSAPQALARRIEQRHTQGTQIDNPQQPGRRHERGASAALEVTAEDRRASYVISARGELDVTNVDRFEHHLRQAEASDARHILVNLTELSFVDSAALRALLVASRRVRRDSRRLSVLATGGVRRIIELTGMTSYLAVGDGG